ncbi:hypothetical protein Tco_1272146, partial [Tanacetum coccineum]
MFCLRPILFILHLVPFGSGYTSALQIADIANVPGYTSALQIVDVFGSCYTCALQIANVFGFDTSALQIADVFSYGYM